MKFQEAFEKAVRNVEQSSGTQRRRGRDNLRLGFEEAAAPGESPRIDRETERKGGRSAFSSLFPPFLSVSLSILVPPVAHLGNRWHKEAEGLSEKEEEQSGLWGENGGQATRQQCFRKEGKFHQPWPDSVEQVRSMWAEEKPGKGEAFQKVSSLQD